MRDFVIREDLAMGVLMYLRKQPYEEVESLVQGLQSLQLMEEVVSEQQMNGEPENDQQEMMRRMEEARAQLEPVRVAPVIDVDEKGL